MGESIVALLRLFEGRVPDAKSHGLVLALASDPRKWRGAYALFGTVRNRNLAAIEAKDLVREGQYCFEEVCLKSLYNETGSSMPAPFDSDSPYWVAGHALYLARLLGIPTEKVTDILAPTPDQPPN